MENSFFLQTLYKAETAKTMDEALALLKVLDEIQMLEKCLNSLPCLDRS